MSSQADEEIIPFFKYEFYVSSNVFLPRPETEILVDVALDYLKEYINNPPPRKIVFVDVGTGTGCIIVSIARELQKYIKAFELRFCFVGIDIDKNAVMIAKKNVKLNSVPVHLVVADKLSPIKEADFVISNPPYVSLELKNKLEVTDPSHSIFGGPRGYELTLDIIEQSHSVLKPGGFLFLEVGYDDLKFFNMEKLRKESKDMILSFAQKSGFYIYPPVRDFRKLERVIVMRKIS